jgi:superfamily II DNA or RNA helicase
VSFIDHLKRTSVVSRKAQFLGQTLQSAAHVDAGSDEHALVEVEGEEVEIQVLDVGLRVHCTCESCYEIGPCEHIWAALLRCRTDGYLGQIEGVSAPILVVASSDDWDGSDDDWDDSDDDWDDSDDDWDDPDDDDDPYARRFGRSQAAPPPRALATPTVKPPEVPLWKKVIQQVRSSMQGEQRSARPRVTDRQYVFVVPGQSCVRHGAIVVETYFRDRKKNGDWGKPRALTMQAHDLGHLPHADRELLTLLTGAQQFAHGLAYRPAYYYGSDTSYVVPPAMRATILPLLCRTGRCMFQPQSGDEWRPLELDEAGPWELRLDVKPAARDQLVLNGVVCRGSERVPLPQIDLVLPGVMILGNRIAWLNDHDAFAWVRSLRNKPVQVPAKDHEKLVQAIYDLPQTPPIDLPESMRLEEVTVAPRVGLRLTPAPGAWRKENLYARLAFDYDGCAVPEEKTGSVVLDGTRRRLIRRDPAAEQAAVDRLPPLGFNRHDPHSGESGWEIATKHLPKAVRHLVVDGWHVEAEGKLYRRSGPVRMNVTSQVDWFELHGDVQFDDKVVELPELLAAVRRGDNAVPLGDGTFGILPEDWLKKYGLLAGLGTTQDSHVRFTRSQVGLLDALLASQPEATCDVVFERLRDELRSFAGVGPREAPEQFVGELRGYQKDGLGWFEFLQRFGFGGCLADDMGLGKTVQVLALLESRRRHRADAVPEAAAAAPGDATSPATAPADRPAASLVVVPKSLVFNWKQEAARFTPQLRVLDHTGLERRRENDHFDDYDLVITTYGTLRRDALLFKDVQFDYVILDEAQAIKNASTESAKAARLLRGDHRLVLSGTPVENHLGELWSLFEFLNPGMLGTASVFQLSGAAARSPDAETRTLLGRALRPFLLRRTKEQVAADLPPKLEQTLYCELDTPQRKLYDELRDHYRASLLRKITSDGMGRSKIQILEALLRLRQAAIHPGLIDKARGDDPSAKLDVLMPQLTEVLDEGHKALVFSQFTSMLAILRKRLDADQVAYEYLDGRTRDRGARVERFQNDPACRLFLVSLKAGGLGLNLTAAEYVFLLDPWWNPAVEAQAIDRTHRIGQTRQVFAYRLIARDTVEEKILELQQGKRALADAIINADNSLIRNLTREDLELLLS